MCQTTSVFISGLEPTLSNLLAVQNPSNFTEAVETASRLETVHTTSKSCAAVGSAPLSGYEEILAALARIEKARPTHSLNPPQNRSFGPRRDNWEDRPAQRVHWQGQSQGSARPPVTARDDDSRQFCTHHKTWGHSTENCRWLNRQRGTRGNPLSQNRRPTSVDVNFRQQGNGQLVPRARRF